MVSKTQDEQNRLIRKQKSPSSLEARLNQLKRISVRLRYLSLMAFLFTALNLVSLIAAAFMYPLFRSMVLHGKYSLIMGSLSSLLAVAAWFAAVIFETSRKQGDALFEEISDLLQLRYYQRLADAEPPEERPFVDGKIILRSFARAADLPIIPGKFGPAVYVAANLMIVITLWLLQIPFL